MKNERNEYENAAEKWSKEAEYETQGSPDQEEVKIFIDLFDIINELENEARNKG